MNDGRGAHPGAVAAVATAFLLVVIVGWGIGWVAAGTQRPASAGGPGTASRSTADRDVPATAIRATASAAAASPTAADSIPPDAFEMPDLIGLPFDEARRAAWSAHLEVKLVFGKDGPAGAVVATKPVAEMLVRPGYRISLHVAGPPPKLQVPEVAGQSCFVAAQQLIEAGLVVTGYPSGTDGTAEYSDPNAGADATWNDRVELYCRR